MSLKFAVAAIAMLLIAGMPANAREDGAPAGRQPAETAAPKLPIHVMGTKASKDTLAILYSGDGGWQILDEKIGSYLRNDGIPVVGVDSLRYFWYERSAHKTAKDLGRIIDYYTRQYNVQHVLLIGYSFGADVMPASYNRLSREQKSKVREISLLSLSHTVDYVVSVRGWLGMRTEGKGGNPVNDVKSIKPELIQCIYGKDDDHDNSCPSLRGTGIQVVGMPGGHRFDGEYVKLAQRILGNLKPLPSTNRPQVNTPVAQGPDADQFRK